MNVMHSVVGEEASTLSWSSRISGVFFNSDFGNMKGKLHGGACASGPTTFSLAFL